MSWIMEIENPNGRHGTFIMYIDRYSLSSNEIARKGNYPLLIYGEWFASLRSNNATD